METVTIKNIARAAGVSIATVSRALYNKPRVNEQTRKHIIKIADDMGYRANKAAQALIRGTITIGVMLSESIPEFDNDIAIGIETAFNKLASLNVKSRIYRIPNQTDYKEDQFLTCLQELSQFGCDGIVLLLDEPTERHISLINDMRRQGIYTAIVVTDIVGSNRALLVRSDGICAGRIAAELLHMLCPKSPIAIFASATTVEICRANIDGFTHEAARLSLPIAHIYENHDDPQLAYRATEHLIENFPEVDGIYVCSSNSSAVCRCLEEHSLLGRYKLITTDLFDDIIRNIDNGYISATLYQNPKKQGELAVTCLYEMIMGNRAADEEILIAPQIVIRSNKDSIT